MGGVEWQNHNIQANTINKHGKLEHNVAIVPIEYQ